jgi:hypothetical protein
MGGVPEYLEDKAHYADDGKGADGVDFPDWAGWFKFVELVNKVGGKGADDE